MKPRTANVLAWVAAAAVAFAIAACFFVLGLFFWEALR